ncbi:MAG: protein-L-isoaspartate O-methyltransferase, partial [Bacteroidales bacterium]|nr:protein-L-isoaspartate O-methyltransferase [Bacteroidales bacterium]
MQQDTFKHKGMRQRLITELREKGISDEAVLGAIGSIPRHCFLDSVFDTRAYQDVDFPIGEGKPITRTLT